MLIDEAKRKAVGATVNDLDVVVTTAGKLTQTDGRWQQKLGLTDTSGHIWAIASLAKNIPIIRKSQLLIKDGEIDTFTRGETEEKRLLFSEFAIPAVSEPPEEKDKFEGVLDPVVESTLARYGVAATEALWPCKRKQKDGSYRTMWVIYHRYCEQVAAKAGIVLDLPQIIHNDKETGEVVLLVVGHLGWVQEWSYGEASPRTSVTPYIWAMAEKRAKDRVILKLAGFHGTVYSESEEDWSK